MRKILAITIIFIIYSCVTPISIGNKISSEQSKVKKRAENSPEIVSPEIYDVVGDYDDYIVMMVVFEPGISDKMHYHGNLLYYVIQGGLMQVTLPDGTVNKAELDTGYMAKQDAGTEHMVKNIGSTIVKILAIEEK
tara:strand:+ start:3701 stop:4108 length:408 start_codon:yes stop_codon:yes gene_type:complete